MKMKNLRWWVIALIALATVINYIDRQTLSVLWPFMGHEIYPEKTDAELKEVYGIISIVEKVFIRILNRFFNWDDVLTTVLHNLQGVESKPSDFYYSQGFQIPSWQAHQDIYSLFGFATLHDIELLCVDDSPTFKSSFPLADLNSYCGHYT